jgi:acetylserotonin N-methyltransferase
MLLADTRDGPLPAASFSLMMATGARGKQYSAGELDGMLREAGFGEATVTPTYGYYSLVSARKPV